LNSNANCPVRAIFTPQTSSHGDVTAGVRVVSGWLVMCPWLCSPTFYSGARPVMMTCQSQFSCAVDVAAEWNVASRSTSSCRKWTGSLSTSTAPSHPLQWWRWSVVRGRPRCQGSAGLVLVCPGLLGLAVWFGVEVVLRSRWCAFFCRAGAVGW